MPLGRLQVPEAGTEACLALLQATARRCRSARVTKGRGEQLCCQLFLSRGKGRGHFRFKAKVAWGGMKGRLEAGGCSPRSPCHLSCHQGAALVYPLQLALQLEGVAGSRRRRGGDGHPAQTGGRHKRPWFRPRCWGRLGEGRRGPSPGRLVCSSEQSRLGSSRKRELPGLWVPGSRQDRSRPIATHAQSSRGGSEGGRALPPRASCSEPAFKLKLYLNTFDEFGFGTEVEQMSAHVNSS